MDAGSVERALQVFVERVTARVPERLRSIVLFGSRARGDARSDSDADVFVVVDRRDAVLTDAIHDVALAVDLEHLTYLSLKICPEAKLAEMRRLGDPFLARVETEGRTLWTPTSRAASATG